jgi:hypothetical protein
MVISLLSVNSAKGSMKVGLMCYNGRIWTEFLDDANIVAPNILVT